MVSLKETYTLIREAMKLNLNLESVEIEAVKETENELTNPEIKKSKTGKKKNSLQKNDTVVIKCEILYYCCTKKNNKNNK